MKLLDLCTTIWGSAEIREASPLIEVARHCLYLPYAGGQAWGLFAEDGQPVNRAIDFREGIFVPSDQILTTRLTAATVDDVAPDGVYIYGGRINPHFGHFLVNTLSRYWAVTKIRSPNTKILYHGSGNPEDWFRIPFVATAFSMLGLLPRDFVSFDKPVRVRSVVVPGTSLEEQHAGYRAYADLCRGIGDRIRSMGEFEQNKRPIYYSKTRLRSAVGVISNEMEIETVLREAGVEIIYPETLSFDDQVRLMSSREQILGSAGSFLHASIFCPPRKITCLNVTEQINSNYTLIDTLAGNSATYHYPPEIKLSNSKEGFLTVRYLPDAGSVARELLGLLDA
ncbi:glycosyltransferase family 61 protein [Methylobacterium sp. J-090]|uniref:glycosyltransferase family 61 protein n=1 Tax=Methylobacterium sp. J-090 TaxID=2836666 RepID=UPI001FBABF54|nr:glycosyltransferase family 61 protein [Methylobacterium sp. J-090]MCJ2081845.1 glycosyltransferase family 61 protein [Methylobacterium sp. J-090]